MGGPLEVGQLVRSCAGRDKDRVYLVCGAEERFLYLTDGRAHPLTKPKKKNPRHVAASGLAAGEIAGRLLAGHGVTDQEVRQAIQLLLPEEAPESARQGGRNDG